jgi:hypothetical protein
MIKSDLEILIIPEYSAFHTASLFDCIFSSRREHAAKLGQSTDDRDFLWNSNGPHIIGDGGISVLFEYPL